MSFYAMYPLFKHFHLTMVATSVLFFIIRFIWLMKGSPLMQKKFVKIAPHVIDTLLLISGVVMTFQIMQYPLTSPWLTEKMLALLAYIFLAYATLNLERGTLFRIFAFLGSLGWVYYMAVLAMTKTPMLLG